MPANWNVPTTANNNWSTQDIERFNRLPFYAAAQQAKQLPIWSRWTNVFPKRKWEANKGDVILGVIDEFSPKSTQVHKPTFITSTPLKTVSSTFQRTNTGRLYRHKFESEQFSFLPNFRDFRTGIIPHATKDINRTVAFGNDDFVRWQAFQLSPHMWCAGSVTGLYTNVPVGPPGEGNLADPKDTAFIQTMISNVRGYLDFKEICAIRSAIRNDLMIAPWEGAEGAPGDNAILNDKYLLIGEPNIFEAMTFDEHVLNVRMLDQDLQHKEWSGVISGNIVFRAERYPIRIAADGTLPAPEIEQLLPANATITSGSMSVTNPGGAARNVEVVPNPAYTRAPFGIAFMIGHAPFETLEVGPPPSEFAGGKVDTARIGKLKWNGEVRLTDNVLVQYGGAAGAAFANMDTNKYGEQLQLICDTVMGMFPNTMRRIIPIIYQRNIFPSRTSQ